MIKIKSVVGYLLIISLIFAFVCLPIPMDYYEAPVVWYINANAPIYAFYVSVLYLFLTISSWRFKYDDITLCLALRCFTCLVPILYIASIDSFTAHYPTVLIALFSYIIARNSKWGNEHMASIVLVGFGLILCYQVVITFLQIPVSYLELSYKRYMRIPLAATNVIAAYLVPIFYLFVFNLRPRKIVKITGIFLFIICIILTKSRGGITCLLVTYLLYILFFNNKFKKEYKFLIICIIGIVCLLLLQLPEIQLFLMGFSDPGADANSLTSGRIDIYEAELQRFLNHPLFGNGMVFNQETSKTGAHNMIVELLVQTGLVGIILYFIPIIIVYRHALKYRNTRNMMGWTLFITAILIHGMFELNFFNYSTDIMFWCACGLIISYSPKTNRALSHRLV